MSYLRSIWVVAVSSLAAASCTEPDPAQSFFSKMTSLCDRTVEGRVVSNQAADADWIGQTLVVGPVTCEADLIRMPLAVGEDQSRTWVLSRVEEGLEFRHEHVEPDGTPSAVTEYGGYAAWGAGTPTQQSFPADDKTKANFTENGIPVSNTNVWTFSIKDQNLTYSLARPASDLGPERDFRAKFNLNSEVDTSTPQHALLSKPADLTDAQISSLKAEVKTEFDRLVLAAKTLDHDSYLSFFNAEQFTALNADGTTISDFKAFRDWYRPQMQAVREYNRLTFDPVSITILDARNAVLINEYIAEVVLTSGEVVTASGAGAQFWNKDTGDWKLVHVSSSSK